MKGIVFNVQKLSIHDGPGIRSTVFFKGCPLRCLWCSNPESQLPEPQISCLKNRCVHCGYCAAACPKGIIETEGDFLLTDRSACDLCLKCVEECCTGAKELAGKEYEDQKLLEEILKDKVFYDQSGGGVTFSGGEPLMQGAFLLRMLELCKDAGLHTALETSGFGDPEVLLKASGMLDLIYYDIKHMDDEEHRRLTGVPNVRILSNLEELAKRHRNIVCRIPCITGLNDSRSNIRETARYTASLGIGTLELLPYHDYGKGKYEQIGEEYTLAGLERPDPEHMEDLAGAAREAVSGSGMTVRVMESI